MSKCPICGNPTNKYMGNERKDGLCKEHAKQFKDGLIFQDENGKWTVKEETKETTTEREFNEQKENKCLTCNNNSGKYLFCKECFARYHGKTLLFKITCDKNQELELLDESYEGVYKCKDGHIVKSKSEKSIDDYLFDHKIAHAYEKTLVIGNEIFKPDFYLKDKDIYIEHWGYDSNNKEYTKRKEYKIPKYKEAKITLIQTNEKDIQDIEGSLDYKLANYKEHEVNEE